MRLKYRILFGLGYDSYVNKLNKLSSQGVHLKKVWFLTVSEFEFDETKKYHYKVIMDKKFNDEIKEYYRYSGWEIIENSRLCQILRGSENSLPIFTDEESEREFLIKKLKRSVFWLIMVMIIYGIFLINIDLFIESLDLFIESLGLVIAGLIGGFIGVHGSIFFLCLYKLIKNRKY